MTSKEIDVKQFKTIEQIYDFIEINALNLDKNRYITDLWVRYRDFTNSESEREKAQWEIFCFIFELKRDQIFPLVFSSGEGNGEIQKYPDLNDFHGNILEYVIQRSKFSKNSILLARYNHLLWKAPNGIKHRDHAINAAISYIKAINEYYKIFSNTGTKEILYQITVIYEILLPVCNEAKIEIDSVKKITNFLLFESVGFEFYVKHSILKDMLEYPKIFKQSDFENSLEIFDEIVKTENDKPNSITLYEFYLSTAIKIAQKTNSDVKKWHNIVGFAYLRMAESETEEDRFWVKQKFHTDAIEAFGLAGNLEKVREVEKLYMELKPKVTLPSHRFTYDEKTQKKLKKHHDYIKKLAHKILKKSPDEVFKVISEGYFFPKYEDVLKASKNKGNGFLKFSTTIRFDNNKNITKQEAIDEEKIELFETYSHDIRYSVLPYLFYIIVSGIKSGHLNYENLVSYIATKSWIGKPHTIYDLSGEGKTINLISILIPSICEFFVQVQAWVNSNSYAPSYILCIDSLTLKMEGLFRSFCERANVPTSANKSKGMQEVMIHNVIENEVIKKYFNEDDRLFFDYLFSNEGGLNLRNNIAHSFYDYGDYNLDQMLLLIAALLRLAKYDYTRVNQ